MPTDAYAGVVARLYPNATLESMVRLKGGVSADVFQLNLRQPDGHTHKLVLRAHGATHSGHPADLEYNLLHALQNGGLPVPKPLHLDISCNQLPTPFLIMEFIEGNSQPPQDDQEKYIHRMAEALATVHAFPVDAAPTLPARINPLPEVFDYLPQGTDWSGLNTYLQALTNTAYTATPKLLHGDFWPENLLWNDSGDIAAILDWEDAAMGDPLSDVAGCGVELRYKFGKTAMQQFNEAYTKHRAIDPERLALWQIYVAAAAQCFMGNWGLAPKLEKHMRTEALASIREAGESLMQNVG